MTWWQVCLFQMGIWTSSFIFYFIHFPINRFIQGIMENNNEIPEKNGQLLQKENAIKIGNIAAKS